MLAHVLGGLLGFRDGRNNLFPGHPKAEVVEVVLRRHGVGFHEPPVFRVVEAPVGRLFLLRRRLALGKLREALILIALRLDGLRRLLLGVNELLNQLVLRLAAIHLAGSELHFKLGRRRTWGLCGRAIGAFRCDAYL